MYCAGEKENIAPAVENTSDRLVNRDEGAEKGATASHSRQTGPSPVYPDSHPMSLGTPKRSMSSRVLRSTKKFRQQ